MLEHNGQTMACNYNHIYYLTSIGLKRNKTYRFTTIEAAEKKLNTLLNKYDTRATKIYNDSHARSYYCDNGVNFYISRD